MLRNSQKQQLRDIIVERGLKPQDFHFDASEENIVVLRHKETDYYFLVEFDEDNDAFDVGYVPGIHSMKPHRVYAVQWAQVLNSFSRWITILKEEQDAEDPWPESIFDDGDENFSEAELVLLDKAVDASFDELLTQAKLNGIDKKLDDVKKSINELKKQARTTPKQKWLELFQNAIATLIIEWGINSIIGSDISKHILKVLFEAAKPVMGLMAGM